MGRHFCFSEESELECFVVMDLILRLYFQADLSARWKLTGTLEQENCAEPLAPNEMPRAMRKVKMG